MGCSVYKRGEAHTIEKFTREAFQKRESKSS